MQPDLKLRFGVGVGLVSDIAPQPPAPGTKVFPSLVADNSSSFTSNNRLYRCRSLASTMSGPKEYTFSRSRAFYIRALQAVLPMSKSCPANEALSETIPVPVKSEAQS